MVSLDEVPLPQFTEQNLDHQVCTVIFRPLKLFVVVCLYNVLKVALFVII